MRLGTLVHIAALTFLLGGVIIFTQMGLTAPDEPIPTKGYFMMGIGALAALTVWTILMALLIYGTRRGYDDI
jgi:hypothetical protein